MKLKTTLRSSLCGQQAGSAMSTALVFLFILLLLSTGSIENSLLETRMASNQEDRYTVFQVADSMSAALSDDLDQFESAIDVGASTTVGVSENKSVNWKVEMVYGGETMPSGYSFKSDGNGFVSHVFEVVGTAENATNSAKTFVRRGVQYIGPN